MTTDHDHRFLNPSLVENGQQSHFTLYKVAKTMTWRKKKKKKKSGIILIQKWSKFGSHMDFAARQPTWVARNIKWRWSAIKYSLCKYHLNKVMLLVNFILYLDNLCLGPAYTMSRDQGFWKKKRVRICCGRGNFGPPSMTTKILTHFFSTPLVTCVKRPWDYAIIVV